MPYTFNKTGDLYVSTLGNDTTGTGAANNPYRTIERAVEDVSASQTIIVGSGHYSFSQSGTSGADIPDFVVVEGDGLVVLEVGNTSNGDRFDIFFKSVILRTPKVWRNRGRITLTDCVFTAEEFLSRGGSGGNAFSVVLINSLSFTLMSSALPEAEKSTLINTMIDYTNSPDTLYPKSKSILAGPNTRVCFSRTAGDLDNVWDDKPDMILAASLGKNGHPVYGDVPVSYSNDPGPGARDWRGIMMTGFQGTPGGAGGYTDPDTTSSYHLNYDSVLADSDVIAVSPSGNGGDEVTLKEYLQTNHSTLYTNIENATINNDFATWDGSSSTASPKAGFYFQDMIFANSGKTSALAWQPPFGGHNPRTTFEIPLEILPLVSVKDNNGNFVRPFRNWHVVEDDDLFVNANYVDADYNSSPGDYHTNDGFEASVEATIKGCFAVKNPDWLDYGYQNHRVLHFNEQGAGSSFVAQLQSGQDANVGISTLNGGNVTPSNLVAGTAPNDNQLVVDTPETGTFTSEVVSFVGVTEILSLRYFGNDLAVADNNITADTGETLNENIPSTQNPSVATGYLNRLTIELRWTLKDEPDTTGSSWTNWLTFDLYGKPVVQSDLSAGNADETFDPTGNTGPVFARHLQYRLTLRNDYTNNPV